MPNKSYYKLNSNNKTIIIDESVKPTKNDKEDIQMYVIAGYIIKYKKKGIKEVDILKALKDNNKALEEYKKIKKNDGYMKALQWFKQNYMKKEEATEETAKK